MDIYVFETVLNGMKDSARLAAVRYLNSLCGCWTVDDYNAAVIYARSFEGLYPAPREGEVQGSLYD